MVANASLKVQDRGGKSLTRKVHTLKGSIIENLRHEQFENPKPPCVIVISIPHIKSCRMRCLAPQKDVVYRVRCATCGEKLRYLCTKEVPAANELSKLTSLEAPKPPICDSDIDSSHQRPSNEMSNSSKRRSSSGQKRLLMSISFAFYVLTMPVHRPNYRNFMS